MNAGSGGTFALFLLSFRMRYRRMPIEAESPEERGYGSIACNLAESSVSDARLGNLDLNLSKLLLAYGDHRGLPGLRALVGKEAAQPADNVLITAGAASGLFIVHTSLLEKDDHLVVVHPNYGTNIETPRAIGCEITLHHLRMENYFQPDLELLEKQVKKNTKLISVTTPHNPSGAILKEETLLALARLAARKRCLLLVDETYRELALHGPAAPYACTLHPRIISVSSVSKAYGLPGVRIGWIIAQDKKLLEKFLAAKEQISICNSVVDETIAFRILQKKEAHLGKIRAQVQRNHKILLDDWMLRHAGELPLEVFLPAGGVVCFPRVSKRSVNISRFYDVLWNKHRTLVGPGHWFGMPENYFRIGFGWPGAAELKKGLENVRLALQAAKK